MAEDIASALFGVEGLRVVDAEREADGTLTVWAITDHPDAAVCPDCGTRAGRVHEHVLTRPRDQRRGLDECQPAWLKRRWKCGKAGASARRSPSLCPRCRRVPGDGRLRALLGAQVAERGCTVAEAGRWQHVSWPVAHEAFAGRATRCWRAGRGGGAPGHR